jgi:hypothetical protein
MILMRIGFIVENELILAKHRLEEISLMLMTDHNLENFITDNYIRKKTET